MKINIAIIAIIVVAVLGFVYFVIMRNRKEQRKLEKELREKELPNRSNKEPKI